MYWVVLVRHSIVKLLLLKVSVRHGGKKKKLRQNLLKTLKLRGWPLLPYYTANTIIMSSRGSRGTIPQWKKAGFNYPDDYCVVLVVQLMSNFLLRRSKIPLINLSQPTITPHHGGLYSYAKIPILKLRRPSGLQARRLITRRCGKELIVVKWKKGQHMKNPHRLRLLQR